MAGLDIGYAAGIAPPSAKHALRPANFSFIGGDILDQLVDWPGNNGDYLV